MSEEYVNGIGAAEMLGIASGLFCYRARSVSIDPDAWVTGTNGRRQAVYSRSTVRDFGVRWESYMSTSRQYRADVRRWRASRPASPARADELIDA
jgi:hypothetical protein